MKAQQTADVRVLLVGYSHDYEVVCHDCDDSFGIFVGGTSAEKLAEGHRAWHKERKFGWCMNCAEPITFTNEGGWAHEGTPARCAEPKLSQRGSFDTPAQRENETHGAGDSQSPHPSSD